LEHERNLAKLIHFRPIFCIFISMLFGIVASRKLFMGDTIYIITVVLAFVVFGLCCIFYRKWIPFVLCLVFFFVGSGMFYAGEAVFKGKEYVGVQSVVGRVTDKSSDSEYYANVVLDECKINGESAKGINLSIYKNDDLKLKTGDIISFNGYVENVHLFTLGSFNLFYLRDNTPYKMEVNSSGVTVTDGYQKLDEKIRDSIRNVLTSNMDENSANLAFAMLTGDRDNLDSKIYEDFSGAGIFHILAVSGLHISILMAALSWLLKKMKVNKYANLSIIFCILIFYCYICGFTPSVIRASVMAMTFLIAGLAGKEYDQLSSWSVAGILLLIINPLSGLDLGFLMSFGSVLCIFLLYRPLKKALLKVFPKYFADAFALSISASLGIVPFTIMMGKSFNLLSVFANIIVLPFFEIVYIVLLAFVILSIIPYVGVILKVPELGLKGIEGAASFFASTSLKFYVQRMDIFLSAIFFVGLYTLSYFLMVSRKVKCLCFAVFACIGSIYGLITTFIKPDLGTSVSCITVYGDTSYFISNEKNELMFVGNNFTTYEAKFMKNMMKDKIDYMLIVDTDEGIKKNVYNAATLYSCNDIITYEKFTGSTRERIVETNAEHSIGGFSFEYVYSFSEYVGVKIYFDNKSIFFTTNSDLSYNNCEYMENLLTMAKFDGVFAGRRNNYVDYKTASDEIFVYSTYDKAKHSLNRLGNVIFNLKTNKIRSLD